MVGFNSDRYIKYQDKAAPDYDSNFKDFNEFPENYFRQKKYGFVVTYLSRPRTYFPCTMDLRFASRKRL